MATSIRKGAKSFKELSPEILLQLNNGEIESANLIEWLAIDKTLLLKNILEQNERMLYFEVIVEKINNLKKKTVNTIDQTIGATLYAQACQNNDFDLLENLKLHNSDAVRCWACYFIADNITLNIHEVLEQIQPFAADSHFGVREVSWLSVRNLIINNLTESLQILTEWTIHPDPNLRRFASEATRPRGVWCQHIEVLKQNPSLGLSILENLKGDPSKYVQNSVANWLNDASKNNPQFVINICKEWHIKSPNKHLVYITKRALRSIKKKI